MRVPLRSSSSFALLLAALSAHGQANLVINGGFSSTYSTGTQNAATPSQLNLNGYGVTGWTSGTSNAYDFVFNSNLAGSAAYTSNGQNGDVQLYTSANGGSATAPASLVSPVGGSFLAASGAFQPGAISQTLNNLAIGGQYDLSFYWAASQQAGFAGMTTEGWGVTFGNQSISTANVTNPDKGFTPWTRFTYRFTASAGSQTLSFLASGGPSGDQRPFSLLDGVSLTQAVPEPGTWAALGLGAVAMLRRRKRA